MTDYQKLQAKYPELRGEIQNDIDGHLRQATRQARQDFLPASNAAIVVTEIKSPLSNVASPGVTLTRRSAR
ncbi:MAG: hypothetical protein H0V18_12275 [Pyrinomonadaceae bacterium]|nr:hypothetical protein [Pyrinomonadaceae bacterium]